MAERTIQTDVLVVGGGGAGFRAAIGARERGASVALLSKGPLARCGAIPALRQAHPGLGDGTLLPVDHRAGEFGAGG